MKIISSFGLMLISNIRKASELNKRLTRSIWGQIAADEKIRKMNLWNLSAILPFGRRINSRQAVNFRIWATKISKERIIKARYKSKDKGEYIFQYNRAG